MPDPRTLPTGVDLLIQNGVVITMDSTRTILYDAALAVADGRIVALGSTDQLAGCFVAKKTINQLHGKTPVGYLHDIGLLGRDVLGAHAIWLSDEELPRHFALVGQQWIQLT